VSDRGFLKKQWYRCIDQWKQENYFEITFFWVSVFFIQTAVYQWVQFGIKHQVIQTMDISHVCIEDNIISIKVEHKIQKCLW